MRLKIENGLDPNQEGYFTQERMRRVFEKCLQLSEKKGVTYGNAWQHQGWMGNLARIMSKTSRIRHMLWRDFPIQSDTEPVEETVLDLINLSAFFLSNMEEGNRWGR